MQCQNCPGHGFEPSSPTSFLETFSCRDFSCRCCSLLTRIHPCSMSDTVCKQQGLMSTRDRSHPSPCTAVARGAASLLTWLCHTKPHLRIQQVQPHTVLHHIIIIGRVPVAGRESHGSAYSPPPNSSEEKITLLWAGSLGS